MHKILIADDERIERMVLYRTLKKKLGIVCEIFEAETGREAVEIVKRERIKLAILDIEMPGINGVTAAQEMKKLDNDCLIIFLTAYDDFCYTKKAITIKATDYLLKPFDEQELLSVVEAAIHQLEEEKEEDDKWKQEIPMSIPENTSELKQSVVTESILDYIKKNYTHDISMQDVAMAMNYSDAYFCKLFKQCFGQNFTSYLTQYRINEAKKLLAVPSNHIKNIGMMVGYSDSNYFTKVFKRISGMSPTEYRLSILNKNKGENFDCYTI